MNETTETRFIAVGVASTIFPGVEVTPVEILTPRDVRYEARTGDSKSAAWKAFVSSATKQNYQVNVEIHGDGSAVARYTARLPYPVEAAEIFGQES